MYLLQSGDSRISSASADSYPFRKAIGTGVEIAEASVHAIAIPLCCMSMVPTVMGKPQSAPLTTFIEDYSYLSSWSMMLFCPNCASIQSWLLRIPPPVGIYLLSEQSATFNVCCAFRRNAHSCATNTRNDMSVSVQVPVWTEVVLAMNKKLIPEFLAARLHCLLKYPLCSYTLYSTQTRPRKCRIRINGTHRCNRISVSPQKLYTVCHSKHFETNDFLLREYEFFIG